MHGARLRERRAIGVERLQRKRRESGRRLPITRSMYASVRPSISVSGSGSGWIRKNQWKYAVANARSVCSYIASVGAMSSSIIRSTAAG
jgi:hypothetical protein